MSTPPSGGKSCSVNIFRGSRIVHVSASSGTSSEEGLQRKNEEKIPLCDEMFAQMSKADNGSEAKENINNDPDDQ